MLNCSIGLQKLNGPFSNKSVPLQEHQPISDDVFSKKIGSAAAMPTALESDHPIPQNHDTSSTIQPTNQQYELTLSDPTYFSTDQKKSESKPDPLWYHMESGTRVHVCGS